jgi:hypothetical protein
VWGGPGGVSGVGGPAARCSLMRPVSLPFGAFVPPKSALCACQDIIHAPPLSALPHLLKRLHEALPLGVRKGVPWGAEAMGLGGTDWGQGKASRSSRPRRWAGAVHALKMH